MPCSGEALCRQEVSSRVANILAASWRVSTRKQYNTYLTKWQGYCGQRGVSPLSATIVQGLDFLADVHESGVGYSCVNTARTTLSTVVVVVNGTTFGNHPLVTRVTDPLNVIIACARHGVKPAVVKHCCYF